MLNIHSSVYVAPGAQIAGNVEIGEDCGVWYNAVVRGDSNTIRVGKRTNIQDLALLHVDKHYVLTVGDNVTIGHSAIVHGCTVGSQVLIGMGAIILNGAEIGDNCIIGAGALVTEGMKIPTGSMVYGSPAKVIRPLREEEIKGILDNADLYVLHAKEAFRKESLLTANKMAARTVGTEGAVFI